MDVPMCVSTSVTGQQGPGRRPGRVVDSPITILNSAGLRGAAIPQTEVKPIALWTGARSKLLQVLRRD